MIRKVLIANRGEIAVRIMRSCRELDILTVAVYSEADRNAMHVRYADEAYYIGRSPSSESYLNIDKIIDAAKKSNAEAIHPGYGFLSENAEFAQRCDEESINFIGPSPYSIALMGDKISARKTMIKAGIPVVPGMTEAVKNEEDALNFINSIGLPVMIKASAGGGGKGMRLVKEKVEIISSLSAARSEALAAFGDDAVYIEKYIDSPHHIEFQILADKFGNVIHLFERECSIQRRHQKIVEETPSPLLTPELRTEMGIVAVEAAKAAKYFGAGTIEFVVGNDLKYYFLEMNTRLQVEHPVTERVVGLDLVKEQLKIAAACPLKYKQEDLKQHGHAIQFRIYAEDTDNNFIPQPGIIQHLSEPHGLGLRCDGYVHEGYEIPVYYDPMITKLISWGQTRKEAIRRMKRGLFEYKITGIKNSIKFLERILDVPDFVDGKYNTHFIDDNRDLLFPKNDPRQKLRRYEDMSIIAASVDYVSKINKSNNNTNTEKNSNNWRNYQFRHGFR